MAMIRSAAGELPHGDPDDVLAVASPQLGHTDAGFTLRVHAHATRRDEGDKERLKALVEGRDWAPRWAKRRRQTLARKRLETRKPRGSRGFRENGRGGFRTCDLSRVKRDHGVDRPPPEQGRLF
jgi:hypothetical protein